MSEQSGKRPRRRRGGRGGQGRRRENEAGQPSADGQDVAPPPGPDGRTPRQDHRGRPKSDRPAGGPPGPPGGGGRTHRSPAAADRPRADRDRLGRGERSRDGASSDRDRAPRPFEAPVPQDEESLALGAAFKEAQIALRDAKKALGKRTAEFSDEPGWMLEQLTAAEKRFEDAATAWAAHLEKTGRKVVRDRR